MKLSDVMSAMGLASFAEIALVIFFAVFIAVVVHVARRKNQAIYERARFLPLDDQVPSTERSDNEESR